MKKVSLINYFNRAAERLLRLFPDWTTGKSEVMKQKYHMKYGARDYGRFISRNKTRTMTAYMLLAFLFLIFEVSLLAGQLTGNDEIRSIKRPASGSDAASVPVTVKMKYKGYELEEDVTLRVRQKALSENEKKERLQAYTIKLEQLILGENKDPDHISKPLNLVERDMDSGITVNWTSDMPELISEKGEVDLIGAKDHQIVELEAGLTLDDCSITQVYRLQLDTDAAEEDFERSMAGRLERSIRRLAEADGLNALDLPEELEDGVSARWFAGSKNGQFPAAFFLIAILAVYWKRYDQVEKEVRDAEESLIKDLPEFINKLVLLLNAGLVVSTALSKIAEDYEMLHGYDGAEKQRNKRYLYDELAEIQRKVHRSNASLIRELKEFSQRCGVREMVRLTAVISDNWDKGSTLAEKLEREGELLWLTRKKRAEEKGKLAETKLTFPLMILLIVLIMITIAPAMLEM